MRIAKLLLAACVVIGPLSVRSADDTDIQTKAREALEKQQQNPPTQPAQPPATAPKQPKKAPAPAPAPAAAPEAQTAPAPATAAPAAAESTVQPAEASQADIDKAREALHEKMQTLNTPKVEAAPQSQPAAPAAVQAVTPAATPTPTAAAAPADTTSVVPTPLDDATIAKARAAMRQKTQELDSQAPAAASQGALLAPTPADPEVIAKAREAMRQTMAQTESMASDSTEQLPLAPKPQPHTRSDRMAAGFPPLHGPPTGLSADKEQRLQSLLQKYKADQITPEQYHAERAKIIGEQQ